MLVLICGSSGAGKDTLIQAARAHLDGEPGIRFARRVITRDADAGGEDHHPVSEAEYLAHRDASGFALEWEAHGLRYGIPADIANDLAAGRVVVASVSRSVIGTARTKFRTQVVEITAPPEVLAVRLAARGREDGEAIAGRLARTVDMVRDPSVVTIMNDSTIETGAARLIATLRRAMAGGSRD